MRKIMLDWTGYSGFSETEVQIGVPSLEANILLSVRYEGASGWWSQIGDVRLRDYDGCLRLFKTEDDAKIAAEAVLRENLLGALLLLVGQRHHATMKLLADTPESPAYVAAPAPVAAPPSLPIQVEEPVLAVPAPEPRTLYVAASVCKRADGAWMALLVVMDGGTGWLERTQMLEGPEWAHQSVAAQLAAIRMAEKFDHDRWNGNPDDRSIATILNHDKLAVQVANNEIEPTAPQLKRVAGWGAKPAPETATAKIVLAPWRSSAVGREIRCIDGTRNPARKVALEWAERLSKDASAMPRTLGAHEMNEILGGKDGLP